MMDQVLIERSIADVNFSHTVGLVGVCIAGVEAMQEGHELSHDDINMIHIPMEIALAFIRHHALEETPLGDAARSSLHMLEAFRSVRRK